MNAIHKNTSERSLFLNGGRLDILMWGYREMVRQIDEAISERRRSMRELFPLVDECPCGCGLQNDICNAHLDAVAAANDEIPF